MFYRGRLPSMDPMDPMGRMDLTDRTDRPGIIFLAYGRSTGASILRPPANRGMTGVEERGSYFRACKRALRRDL
jgi:hypothetical protein